MRILDSIRRHRGQEVTGTGAFIVGGVLVSLAIIGAGIVLDQRSNTADRKVLERHVADDVRLIRSAIDARIEADLDSASHLADMVMADADLKPVELNAMTAQLIKREQHIRDIVFRRASVAPGVSSAPKLALASDGQLVLDFPIGPLRDGNVSSWGSIVMTLDTRKFLEASGLVLDATTGARSDGEARQINLDYLDFAIRSIDPNGAGTFIFGSPEKVDDNPVTRRFAYPGGFLEILAKPKDGWNIASDRQFTTRLIIAAACLMMILPVYFSLYLLRERNRHIDQLKAREQKLLDLSRRFNLAMGTANIGIWEVHETTGLLSWDVRAAVLHGLAPSDGCESLAAWYKRIHPEDAEQIETNLARNLSGAVGDGWDITYRVTLQDGTLRHLRSVGARSHGDNGLARLTGIVWDVTKDTLSTKALYDAKAISDIKNAELELALDELSSREHELAELSQKLDLALASYNCGIWEGDPVSKTAYWDERMHQLYGLPFKDRPVTEHEWLSCLHQDDRQDVRLESNRGVTSGKGVHTTQRVLLPNNDIRYVRSVGQVHIGRDGKKKIIGIAFDVTADAILAEQLRNAKAEADSRNLELELAKNRIEFNALHDPLTSLANRRKLDLELDELTQAGTKQRQKFTILHLDLDRFKEINDTLGHAAGDAMLVHASKVLTRNVARGDLVARIGGDEFVILARRATSAEEISTLCERIIEEMSKPIDFEGFTCRCGISIGIAQTQGLSPDARRILVNADIALYQAKEKGRNCYEFFTPDLQANIVSKKRMADEILTGLERDEFTVWYQPQFETSSMELSGAEALVRWNHPDKGIIPSNSFLRIAEELNVMARIDQLVLETSLKDQMRWVALGLKLPRVSVNVSSKRLHDAQLVEQLESLNITPGTICFELVESIFLDESDDVATTNIDRIKALGIDIEIDDFGTGHTSIVSLLRLKPKRLKIDRQLVMPIVTQPQERALVRSIIEIARSLGVETVAEGVESHEHAGLLRQLGCDYLQGYAFAKPLPFEEFTRFARGLPRRKAS